MLRPGRLDKLIYVGLPNATERAAVMRAIASRTPMASDVDLEAIGASDRLDGFSGADLFALVREAAVSALRAAIRNGSKAAEPITTAHFEAALGKVYPSLTASVRL